MARTKKHAFNVLMSEHEVYQLDQLAKEHHCARSFIVRQTIRWRFEMMTNGTALCANGQRCFAPHLHQSAVSPPPDPPGA